MTTITNTMSANAPATTLTHRWGWLLALGVVQIIVGSIAIAVPVVASLAAVAIFAAVQIVTAIFQLIHAFEVGSWPRSAWYGLSGVLYAIAGFLVVAFPLGGALTLAVLLAILFIADGALRVLFAMTASDGCRPRLAHSSGILRHSYRGHPADRMADDGIVVSEPEPRAESVPPPPPPDTNSYLSLARSCTCGDHFSCRN